MQTKTYNFTNNNTGVKFQGKVVILDDNERIEYTNSKGVTLTPTRNQLELNIHYIINENTLKDIRIAELEQQLALANTNQSQINNLKNDNIKLQSQLNVLQTSYEERGREIKVLNQKCNRQFNQINTLKSKLHQIGLNLVQITEEVVQTVS